MKTPVPAFLLLALTALPVHAAAPAAVTAPPPVSGRSLAAPESITSADTLARVLLIRDNLQLIRRYMGRPEPHPPILRVEGAQPREVFFQSYNLLRRAHQLAFEHLRTPLERLVDLQIANTPAAVLGQLNETLVEVLQVKQSLGIDAGVPEKAQPETTTSSEVFNAIVETGQLMHLVLERQTTASDVYAGVTMAVNVAMAIHAQRSGGFLPDEPPFVAEKTPADVYMTLHRCLEHTRKLAASAKVEMLRFSLPESGPGRVTPDDVTELVALLIAELTHLHQVLLGEHWTTRMYLAGRRYPAHTFQRASLLEAVLRELAPKDAGKGGR